MKTIDPCFVLSRLEAMTKKFMHTESVILQLAGHLVSLGRTDLADELLQTRKLIFEINRKLTGITEATNLLSNDSGVKGAIHG